MYTTLALSRALEGALCAVRVLELLIGGCGLAHQKGGRDRKAILSLVFVADSWGGLPENVGPNTPRRASVPSQTDARKWELKCTVRGSTVRRACAVRLLGLLLGGCGLAHQKGGRDRKAIIWLVFLADSCGACLKMLVPILGTVCAPCKCSLYVPPTQLDKCKGKCART